MQRKLGDLTGAGESYRCALRQVSVQGAPRFHMFATHGLAQVLLQQGTWLEAEQLLSSMLDTALSSVLVAPSLGEQRQLIADLLGIGDMLAWALLRQGRPEAAFVAAGRGRAILLAATLAADRLRTGEELSELRQARSTWEQACRAAEAADAALITVEELDETRLQALRTRRHEAGEAVRRGYEHFNALLRDAGLNQLDTLPLAVVADAVPPGGALVLPVIVNSGGAALLLRRDGSAARMDVLELPALTLKAVVDLLVGEPSGWLRGYGAFNAAIAQAEGSGSRHAVDAWNGVIESVLEQLWQLLMGPLREGLERLGVEPGSEVALCLPGRLAPLPLHAAGKRGENSRWRCFLDDYAVSYVPSPQALVASRARAAEQHRLTPSLLAVTNPTSDRAIEVVENPAWPFFPSAQRKELRHGQATLQAVTGELERTEPGWTYLSLYAHGVWNNIDPEASGLYLADGRLTVQQLRQLRVPAARLAYLAACETGLIGLNLPDEYVGLPGALLEAGIPGVAASLWPVETIATQQLAAAFFQTHLEGCLNPAQALRHAQLALRDAALEATGVMAAAAAPRLPSRVRPSPRHALPVYWAAFGFTGA